MSNSWERRRKKRTDSCCVNRFVCKNEVKKTTKDWVFPLNFYFYFLLVRISSSHFVWSCCNDSLQVFFLFLSFFECKKKKFVNLSLFTNWRKPRDAMNEFICKCIRLFRSFCFTHIFIRISVSQALTLTKNYCRSNSNALITWSAVHLWGVFLKSSSIKCLVTANYKQHFN